MFQPIEEQPFKKVRVEPDVNSLYGFFGDFSLFPMIGIAIWLCIDRFSGEPNSIYTFELVMIFVGIAMIAVIVASRNRAQLTYIFIKFKKNRLKTIIFGINLLATGAIILIANYVKGVSWAYIKDMFIVGVWEQLVFSIAIPYLFVLGIVFVFKWEHFKILASIPACIISGVLFGFAHEAAYNDLRTIGYLIGIGIPLHLGGYLLPTVSIVVHLAINVFIGG